VNRKNFFIMFTFSALVVTAMTALGIDHSRKTRECHDVRLYMDGSFDAKVETGGLTPHTDITLYRLVNMKNIKIDREPASVERRKIDGLTGDFYLSQHVQFFVPDQAAGESKPRPALLNADLPAEKIKASLICSSHS
jgi:hypothetical protein